MRRGVSIHRSGDATAPVVPRVVEEHGDVLLPLSNFFRKAQRFRLERGELGQQLTNNPPTDLEPDITLNAIHFPRLACLLGSVVVDIRNPENNNCQPRP